MTSNKTICEGCLSMNRTLSVTKSDIRILLQEIIEDVDTRALWLCWECEAVIRRFLKLKQQMRRAQKELVRYMLLHTNITPLSRLTTTHCSVINISSDETKEDTTSNDVLSTVFVKVEDMPILETDDNSESDANDNDTNDELHSDCHNDNTESNDNDLKDVPEDNKDNKDSVQLISGVAQNIKVRKKSRIKTKESFNESDDEPLKLNEHKVEPTRKGKEKEVTKKDRRKREKPAGVVTNSRVTKKLEQLNVSGDQLEMVLLSWEEVETERQAAMAHHTFTRHQSRCHDCVLGFNHPSKLEEHMRKHTPIQDGAQCTVCRVWCKDSRSLSAHRRRHRLRWRCRICGGAWSRAANAADHTARAHGAPPPTHTCALCGHHAQTLGKLRYHLKSHAERQKCELCGKTFRDRTSLRTHLFIHKGEKNYACPKCEKRFLFKSAMEIHLETHNASAQLYCHQCDMNFKNRMSYNQHMRYNLKHIDPAKLKYACDTCDKKFAKATRLQEHKMAVHLKLTPIACTLPGCHFSCSSRPVLRTHIRMQHRDGRDKRNHVCHLCGKAYASKNSLEGHLRAHSGERPLRCARCPASFGYDAALYNHVKHVHLKHKKIRSRCPQTAEWTLTIPTPTDET